MMLLPRRPGKSFRGPLKQTVVEIHVPACDAFGSVSTRIYKAQLDQLLSIGRIADNPLYPVPNGLDVKGIYHARGSPGDTPEGLDLTGHNWPSHRVTLDDRHAEALVSRAKQHDIGLAIRLKQFRIRQVGVRREGDFVRFQKRGLRIRQMSNDCQMAPHL